jgi:hypothetical protein
VFKHENITVSLLRRCNESEFQAVAHFTVVLQQNAPCFQKSSAEQKGPEYNLQVCKFDTLTFEQLGSIVQLPIKTSHSKQYLNIPLATTGPEIECDTNTISNDEEDKFNFPANVFDEIELPLKNKR